MGHFQYHHRTTIQFEVYHFIIDKHSINFINIDFRVNTPTKRAKESNVIEVFDTNNKCICYLIVFIRVLFCSLFSFSASNWRHHFAERSILFVQWTECVFVCVQENRFSDNTETSIFFLHPLCLFRIKWIFFPIRYNTVFGRKKAIYIFPLLSFSFLSVPFSSVPKELHSLSIIVSPAFRLSLLFATLSPCHSLTIILRAMDQWRIMEKGTKNKEKSF